MLKAGDFEAIPNGSGKGNLILNGTLDLNAMNITLNGLSGAGLITTGQAVDSTLWVGVNDQTSEFSGTIEDGSGTVRLVKIGAGTLTLSGENTYSDETIIAGGTLKLGADDALPVTGIVQIGDSTLGPGTFDLGGHQQTVLGLYSDAETSRHRAFWDEVTNSGGATATLTVGDSGDCLYAGDFSGNLTLHKYGQGSWILTGNAAATVAATVYDGILDIGVGYLGSAYTAAGQGNPQIIRRVTPYYGQISLGAISGDDASQATGSLAASSSPVFVKGDWKTAVQQAVSGTIHIGGNDYSFPGDGFLVGTVAELKMAIDGNLDAGSGKFRLYQNPAYPDLYGHSDTKVIVLEDQIGQPVGERDYSDAYWVVGRQQLTWLAASSDQASVAGKEGQQVANSGTWADLNLNSPATMWATVGHVIKNADGTWVWFYTPGNDPSNQTVTVTLSDSGVETTTSFSLAVNAAPKTSGIASLTLERDTPSSVIDLWSAFSDREDPDSALSFAVVGDSNPNLITAAVIDPDTGELTLTFAAGVWPVLP